MIAVLVYHANYSWLPGGFLGVDVFFVLSGYLITALLITEYQRTGRIDIRTFWWRRARRLLPAVFLLLVGVLAYASIFLRAELAELRVDALAATAYVTNWWLVLEDRSYFEAMGRPSLFQHLWSLAVEEQFYLLWPAVFIVLMRWWRRWVPALLVLGVLASTALMWVLYDPYADPSRIYYGTDTRSAALLLGSLLAFVWRPGVVHDTRELLWTGPRWSSVTSTNWFSRCVPALMDVVAIAAIVTLITLFFRLNEFAPRLYQGGFLLTAAVAAVAIAAVAHPGARLVPWILGRQPFQWLGTRSYGIYLWHWPIFMVTRPHLDVPLDGIALFAVRLTITFAIAELSYRLVETPVRRGALEDAWRRWWVPGTRGVRLVTRRVMAVGAPAAAVAVFVVAVASVATIQEDQSGFFVADPNGVGSQASRGPLAPHLDPAPTPGAIPGAIVDALPFEVMTPTFFPQSASVANPPTSGGPGEGTGDEVVATPPVSDSEESPSSVSVPPSGDDESLNESEAPGSDPELVSPSSASVPLPPGDDDPRPSGESVLPVGDAAVTAIGDSVMLGAVEALGQVVPGVRIDGEVGMQASRALSMLHGMAANGAIADLVVLHIGSNGIVREGEFAEMMELLSDAERVVVVNVKVPRAWEHQNNALFARMVGEYPNAVLVDWNSASSGDSSYFWTDGIHLRPEGAAFYASLIAEQLR